MNRIVLLLVAVVLMGIAAFAVLWMGVDAKQRGPADQILTDWRAGRLPDVYKRASAGFRERQSAAEFQTYMNYWAGELGAFESVTRRLPLVSKAGPQGLHEKTTLEVAFAKGPATVLFFFDAGEPTPRLEHLCIRKVEPGAPQTDRSGLEPTSRALMGYYDRSEFAALYAGLSVELQWQWTLANVQAQLTRLRGILGAVKEMKLRDTQEAHGDLVIQYFAIDFEKTGGTAKVSYGWRGGRWQVIGFVLSPE
jgi:hypothetical protein